MGGLPEDQPIRADLRVHIHVEALQSAEALLQQAVEALSSGQIRQDFLDQALYTPVHARFPEKWAERVPLAALLRHARVHSREVCLAATRVARRRALCFQVV